MQKLTKFLVTINHYSNKHSGNNANYNIIVYNDGVTSTTELAQEIFNSINQYDPTTKDTSAEIKLQDIRESLVTLLRGDSDVSIFPERERIYDILKLYGDKEYSAVQYKIVKITPGVVQLPIVGVVSDIIFDVIKCRNTHDTIKKIFYYKIDKVYISTEKGTYLVTSDEITLQKHGIDKFHASTSFETFKNANEFIRSELAKGILFCGNIYKYTDEYVSKIQQYNADFKSLNYILNSDHVNITDYHGNKLYKLDHQGKEGYDMSCVPLSTITDNMVQVF